MGPRVPHAPALVRGGREISVDKQPEEQPLNELGTAIEAMRSVPWTTLQELKADETTLRKLDEAETLLKSLRKALTSE